MEYIKAEIIGYTQPSEKYKEHFSDVKDLVAYCARVSNPSNQLNTETTDKLIKYLIRNKHWSPLEMSSVTMQIDCPRDIARQLLRHRSFSFQEFCIAGESLIKTDTGAYTIEDLFSAQENYEDLPKVKVYNEVTKIFQWANILEVFDTGVKPTYQLTLANGRKITATTEHKFLTKKGFVTLGEINVGDFVGTNGIPCYQNKEWMTNAKREALQNSQGVQYIADKADISYHTIRKWLRIHGLQLLCNECHKVKSSREFNESPNYSRVVSIEFVGEINTFDLEVDHVSHNYVANGIVSHNSQRYADPTKDMEFILREARLQDTKNRQNSIEVEDTELRDMWYEKQLEVITLVRRHYSWAVSNGLAKEQARVILPEGNTMSRLYVQGTIRSWIHYIEVREHESTQKEHRTLANKVAEAITQVFDYKEFK